MYMKMLNEFHDWESFLKHYKLETWICSVTLWKKCEDKKFDTQESNAKTENRMSQWGKDDENEDAVTYQLITIREVPMIIPLLENLQILVHLFLSLS